VVINTKELGQMFQAQLPQWDVGSELAVMGIVNLAAIPKEKERIPLGDPGNPIPLVRFTNFASDASQGPAPAGRRRKPKSRARRR